MKNILLIKIVLLCTLYSSYAQETTEPDIEITIDNITNEKGTLLVGLYKDPANFLKIPFRYEKVQPTKGSVKVVFTNVAKGEYAISLIHDENDNGKMDTNLLGIPKENYGVSNNAKNTFSAPKWEDAKFTVTTKDVIQRITL